MKPEQAFWKIANNILDKADYFCFTKEDGSLKIYQFSLKYGSAHIHMNLGDPRWISNIHLYYSIGDLSWTFWLNDMNDDLVRVMLDAFDQCYVDFLCDGVKIE